MKSIIRQRQTEKRLEEDSDKPRKLVVKEMDGKYKLPKINMAKLSP
jgi:hypothetical protein